MVRRPDIASKMFLYVMAFHCEFVNEHTIQGMFRSVRCKCSSSAFSRWHQNTWQHRVVVALLPLCYSGGECHFRGLGLLVVSVTGPLDPFVSFHCYSATYSSHRTGRPQGRGDSGPRPVARTWCFTPCDPTDQMMDAIPIQHEKYYFSWRLLRHPLGTKGWRRVGRCRALTGYCERTVMLML